MGLDFIRETAKPFEQKRDKSKEEELDVPDLLSRGLSDEFVQVFRCELSDSESTLIPGFALIARAYSESEVIILQRGKVIGHMLFPDVLELTRLMKLNHRHHGVITLFLQDEPGLDGVFTVKPKKPFKRK